LSVAVALRLYVDHVGIFRGRFGDHAARHRSFKLYAQIRGGSNSRSQCARISGSRELFTLAVQAVALGIAWGSSTLFGVCWLIRRSLRAHPSRS
jgi:hypothetical protein